MGEKSGRATQPYGPRSQMRSASSANLWMLVAFGMVGTSHSAVCTNAAALKGPPGLKAAWIDSAPTSGLDWQCRRGGARRLADHTRAAEPLQISHLPLRPNPSTAQRHPAAHGLSCPVDIS